MAVVYSATRGRRSSFTRVSVREADVLAAGTLGALAAIELSVRVGIHSGEVVRSDDQVRTTYDRQQFSNAWIGHTGGIVYVIHPESVPLPKRDALQRGESNW